METATENKPGFAFEGKQIYFIEGRGKDISFDRWRVTLYYAPNFALTHFLPTQKEYDDFMREHQPLCYEDYNNYKELSA